MKKFFSLVLALVMALSLTTVAWGAIDSQANLEAAIPSGGEVILDTDITLSSTLIITNGVTLNLNGKTITGEIEITTTDAVVIKNGNITNAAAGGAGRCIDTRVGVDLTIDGVTMTTTGSGNTQPLTIGGPGSTPGKVTLKNSTITASSGGYGIINFTPVALTIENSTITGYAALYMKAGSNGSVVNITNSTLTGIGHEGASNAFGTIVFEDDGIEVNVYEGSIITATGSQQEIFETNSNDDDGITITGGTFSEDVSEYVADGYRLVNGTVAAVPANTTGVVGGYEGQLTVKGAPRQAITNFTKTAAVTPDDVNEDGLYNMPGDVIGSIEYYTFNLGGGVAQNYYQVDSVNDADLIVYVGDSLVPYMYLANEPAGGFQYWYGVASFNDFGSACGQFKYVDYDATKSYYTYAGQVFVLDDDGAVNLKVGTKFVQANVITADGKWVAHTPVFTQNNKGVVTGISCAKCTDVGVIVANYAALPTAMKAPSMNFQVPGSTTQYYYWVDTAVVAPSTPSTDKVQSAETFDAGIAMYVGMSVMAAAGSAVVLKKKD